MSTSRTVKFCMGGKEKAPALVCDEVFQDEMFGNEKGSRDAPNSGAAT